LIRSEFVISGFSNRDLRSHLTNKNTGQVTRLIRRLREHGLIKRVNQRYRYYLTEFGRQITLMALKLRDMVIIPSLAFELA
jgi:DNA-binding HxlR family transcriptional regulator